MNGAKHLFLSESISLRCAEGWGTRLSFPFFKNLKGQWPSN
jgi:hypothetical protein